MSITKSDVKRVAHLARIRIEPGEVESYAQELSTILDLVGQMDSVPTNNIQPLAHPQDIELRLRLDEVTEVNSRERLQLLAPATTHGLYLVPKVIE